MSDNLSILSNPDLFNIITEQQLNKKIVKEFEARKTVFLVAHGRLVRNAVMTSYNLMANSASGTGKDWVIKHTLEILPEGSVIYQNKMTPAAFTYWHKDDPSWTWDGKALYLEDVSNKLLRSEVFKTMSSSGTNAVVVNKKQETEEIYIRGKSVMIITTNDVLPSDDMYRRFPILFLNDSVNQTKAIMKRQSEMAMTGIKPGYNEKLREALNFLEPVSVKIPFADEIDDQFPSDHVIMRTHYPRFLDYIKASAALHQKQRETEGELLVASEKDFDIAKIALKVITQNPLMIPLTKKMDRLLKIFKEGEWYSAKDLMRYLPWTPKTIYKLLDILTAHGFLIRIMRNIEGVDREVQFYQKIELGGEGIDKMRLSTDEEKPKEKLTYFGHTI